MTHHISKLIRDKIADELSSEDRARLRVSTDSAELSRLLALKWVEESSELIAELTPDHGNTVGGVAAPPESIARLIDEMADVQEVLSAIREHFNISEDDVKQHQAAKYERRGGFERGHVLSVPLKNQQERWHLSHVGPIVPFLNRHITQSTDIRIAVSFILGSGVSLIADALKTALANGAQIRILTSTYLDITEPDALQALLDLSVSPGLRGQLRVRLYEQPGNSFHAKAWIFTDSTQQSRALVGSSNISYTALTKGIEWNYHVHETDSGWPVEQAVHHYESLFDSIHTRELTQATIDEYALRRVTSNAAPEKVDPAKPAIDLPVPNAAQADALMRLSKLRQLGHKKGLVVAATGIGKTFLAAFDSQAYPRVLFVAHRVELLQQAERSFRRIRPNDRFGRLYAGHSELNSDVLFASIQSLAGAVEQGRLRPDDWDYLVIDEFHHAGAKSYRRLLQSFNPHFLLGLTATPYRQDNVELLALCDHNVAYRVLLHDAIGMGWLCPFRYFGVNDETDYADLKLFNGQYRVDDVERLVINDQRNASILAEYNCYASRCAVGFCVSIAHADAVAAYFASKGIRCAALHSQISDDDKPLQALRNGEIEILFAVDMLNEGVDVPEIDLVMFLRPTQSVTLFLQQLGRGLRKHGSKSHLTVLDFIGNYKGAEFKLPVLSGDYDKALDGERDDERSLLKEVLKRLSAANRAIELDTGIRIQLDPIALEKIKALLRQPLEDRLIDAFNEVKAELGQQPTILDIHRYGRFKPRTYLQQTGAASWLLALSRLGLSTAAEDALQGSYGELLQTIESTAMSRAYKMVILRSLLERKALFAGVGLSDLVTDFKSYYRQHPVAWSELDDTTRELIESDDDRKLTRKLIDMPIHYWESEHFALKPGGQQWACISLSTEPDAGLAAALKDRCDWRLESHLAKYQTGLSKFKVVCGKGESDKPHIQISGLRVDGRKPEGWQKVSVNGKTVFMKFAKIAINVAKPEPVDDQSVKNVLPELLMDVLGVKDRADLNGRWVCIEPSGNGDGFYLGCAQRQQLQTSQDC